MPDDELIQLITLAVFRYIALEWVYVAIEQFFIVSMPIPPSQAQQDTTEKEKVQSFFGLSLFYAAQILNVS